jgi:hypothetical protein
VLSVGERLNALFDLFGLFLKLKDLEKDFVMDQDALKVPAAHFLLK